MDYIVHQFALISHETELKTSNSYYYRYKKYEPPPPPIHNIQYTRPMLLQARSGQQKSVMILPKVGLFNNYYGS